MTFLKHVLFLTFGTKITMFHNAEVLVKQFHCNKRMGTNGDEKVLSSWVNGQEIHVKTSILHSTFPYSR